MSQEANSLGYEDIVGTSQEWLRRAHELLLFLASDETYRSGGAVNYDKSLDALGSHLTNRALCVVRPEDPVRRRRGTSADLSEVVAIPCVGITITYFRYQGEGYILFYFLFFIFFYISLLNE